MHKLFILPIIVSIFFADFGAIAATVRGSRSGGTNANNNATVASAPVAARAAVRGAKTAPTQTTQPAVNTAVSARAATRNTPQTTTNVAATTKASTTGSVAARAGSKQKVINMGTKISGAVANTVVSQECQDAYFGCMDSFCMLENVTGGRCKCSDKNTEYDKILAEIMKQDQQSYVIQTEGASLIKMGKSADDVYAMAEEAAKKVSKDKKEDDKGNAKKKTTLDLSAWNNSFFDDDDDVFEEDIVPLESGLTVQTGDKLHATAASICTKQLPTQCGAAGQMLRMIYVQRIQSDCAAYDNSLKQQQMESNQKLQTARQTLRDTALEKYQEANKYDLSGCVRALNTCMQKEETCGEGFAGCVTFAATDNMQNKKVAEQPIVRGAMTSIKLSASTMDELLSKRVYCDSVLAQCVKANENDAVWLAFLKSAAPAIKTAELDVEDNLRRSCNSDAVSCFKEACKAELNADESYSSYDMCLSNPLLFKSLCKPKIEPCLLATGGTYDNPEGSSLWDGWLKMLASSKVGACTTEIKECLLSEDRCGADYAKCIGLTTEEITNLCPTDKLTACRDERQGLSGAALEADIRKYVADIAMGLALDIDDSMSKHCEKALKTAMLTYCGDETECPNAAVDENLFKGVLTAKLCKKNPETDKIDSKSDCSTDLTHFSELELLKGDVSPVLWGRIDVSAIQFNDDNKTFELAKNAESDDDTYSKNDLTKLQNALNNNYKAIINSITEDPKVVFCTTGRKVQGFDAKTFIGSGNNETARFPNLTKNVQNAVVNGVLLNVPKLYWEQEEAVRSDDLAALTRKLNDRINSAISEAKALQDGVNLQVCESFTDADGGKDITPEYDPKTGVCTLTFIKDEEITGSLQYQFPLMTASYVVNNLDEKGNPVIKNEEDVRCYQRTKCLRRLKDSTINNYSKEYGGG